MKTQKNFILFAIIFYMAFGIFLYYPAVKTAGADLPEIKKSGVLRHLGIPYANFVTGSGDGLDVELMQLFAKHLGVKYEYVKTDWDNIFQDLTGKQIKQNGNDIIFGENVPIKGDVIANGMTKLAWREQIVHYSHPTFPTQVWLVARADSTLKPIKPSGKIENDIARVKSLLKGHTLLGKAKTCLEPALYKLEEFTSQIKLFPGSLNDLAPAVINDEAEVTLLDVPDALVALEKWPGRIKVIGPISEVQEMGCGFDKNAPLLLQAFNEFYKQCVRNGVYQKLVKKYYPTVFLYFPDFFKK